MLQIFNVLAQKTTAFLNSLAPERIHGRGIDLSAGTPFYSTLRYAVHENRTSGQWDIIAQLKNVSRLSPRHQSIQTLPVLSLARRQDALAVMESLEPGLERQAAFLLSRMGVKNPVAAYPALARFEQPARPARLIS